MNGILALQGGGPFVANDDLDRRLTTAAGATRVVMLPTADAYEHPELLVAEKSEVRVLVIMVLKVL